MRMNKKGMTLSDLGPAAIAFVFIAIVLAIGADVITSVGADAVNNSGADNATTQGLQAVEEMSTWLPTIALVIAAAVVIGVLMYFKS